MKEAERRHPGQFAVEYYVVIARSHLVSMPKLKMGKKRKKKAASEASNTATSSSTDEPIFDFYENELIHRVTASNFCVSVRLHGFSHLVFAGKRVVIQLPCW